MNSLHILLSDGIEIEDAGYDTRDEARVALFALVGSISKNSITSTRSEEVAFLSSQFVAAWVPTEDCPPG